MKKWANFFMGGAGGVMVLSRPVHIGDLVMQRRALPRSCLSVARRFESFKLALGGFPENYKDDFIE